MERIITFQPAFDKRHEDPKKNYGIHGVTMRMVLVGEKGATQFVLYTGWHLPHVRDEREMQTMAEPTRIMIEILARPLPADLGYHSLVPQYEGQEKMEHCDYFEGGCYYDGSGLAAEEVFDLLVSDGSDAVWKRLGEEYKRVFEENE